jgi:ataxia telangiectasia mutated family protein
MRRCSEATLRTLRGAKRSLLTVVEVLIHDPLYRWALTPADAQRRQPQRSAPGDSPSTGGAGGGATGDPNRAVLWLFSGTGHCT